MKEWIFPGIKNIIELDFLGGSRRQQLQIVGRLMHSITDGAQYYLIMSHLLSCKNMKGDFMDCTQDNSK